MEFCSNCLLNIIIVYPLTVITENLKCSRQISENEIHWFCCDNREEKNGTCVECETGYISEKGSPCQPCSNDTYGRKCGEICQYKEHQRCDHIIGCTELTDWLISTLEPRKTNYDPPDTTVYTSTMSVGQDSTTHKEIRQYSYVYTTVDTSIRPTTDLQFITDKSPNLFSGLLKREIVIYSVVIGIFILATLVCITVIYRYRKKLRINLNNPGNTLEIQHDQGSTVEKTDGIYDIIDESQITDIPIYFENLSDEHSQQSNDKSECVSIGDGYIIPSNSLKDGSVSHSFLHKQLSDSSSSSSKSLKMKLDYLNPYQQPGSVSDHHSYSNGHGSVKDSSLIEDVNNASCVVFSGDDINIYYSTNRPSKGSVSPESNSDEFHPNCHPTVESDAD